MTDWQRRHNAALLDPTEIERPLAALVFAIDKLVQQHKHDYVLREGIADLIMGTQAILTAEHGRFDRGTIDSMLTRYAEQINFDLDIEKFRDS